MNDTFSPSALHVLRQPPRSSAYEKRDRRDSSAAVSSYVNPCDPGDRLRHQRQPPIHSVVGSRPAQRPPVAAGVPAGVLDPLTNVAVIRMNGIPCGFAGSLLKTK